jgi:LytR cell envelope-related transcriptional attenuator
VRSDESGFAMSSPVALMCGAAVIMAGLAFFTSDPAEEPAAATPVAASPQPERPSKPVRTEREATVKPRVEKVLRRESVYVSVFNNSNISGLAAVTAERIGAVGWQVVGSDNWYGTIPATTIYYPDRLEEAAKLLSKDLGVPRVMPAVDPMSMDRLTVILTADFA